MRTPTRIRGTGFREYIAAGRSSAAGHGAVQHSGGGISARGHAPEIDPARKISEQDCTKPIVLDGGNLRCK